MVVFSALLCITIWLPFRRTSENPWRDKMAHTSCPERTRSLPNLYLESGNKHFPVLPAVDLSLVGSFQEQFNCFLKVLAGGLDGVALAGNVELRAQSDIASTFALNNGRELLHTFRSSPKTF